MAADLQAAKLDHGLAALRLAQMQDPQVPRPGMVSIKTLARLSGLSPAYVHRIERIALAKVLTALLADPEPPPQVRALKSRALARGVEALLR